MYLIRDFKVKSKIFLICAMYLPLDNSSYLHPNFKNLFPTMSGSATENSKEVILMGDSNVNYHRRQDNTDKIYYFSSWF